MNSITQLEKLLGVQTRIDDARMGGDLGGVLVLRCAEHACGGSSGDGGGVHGPGVTVVVVAAAAAAAGFAVRGR